MSQTISQKRTLKTDYARPHRQRLIHDCIDRTPISRPETVFSKVCRYVILWAWFAALSAVVVVGLLS